MKKLILLIAICCLLAMPLAAHADSFGFMQITNNGNTPVAGQLSVDVLDNGSGQIKFTFSNIGPIASSICDIYFQDGPFLGISSIVNMTGVSFSDPATPGDLPGGTDVGFVTTKDFSADSDSPHLEENGVNPGEKVSIIFSLLNGKTYADTLAAINNGDLRIGLHVQAIGTLGGSESFVNTPPSVPEPATLLLLGFGLVGLAGVNRKFKK